MKTLANLVKSLFEIAGASIYLVAGLVTVGVAVVAIAILLLPVLVIVAGLYFLFILFGIL